MRAWFMSVRLVICADLNFMQMASDDIIRHCKTHVVDLESLLIPKSEFEAKYVVNEVCFQIVCAPLLASLSKIVILAIEAIGKVKRIVKNEPVIVIQV